MICKWCGEKISATEMKCRKCGRDVPPMSDCGGFYNLIQTVQKPSEFDTEKQRVMPRRKNRYRALLAIAIFCFSLALLVMAFSLHSLRREIAQLQDNYIRMENKYDLALEVITEQINDPRATDEETPIQHEKGNDVAGARVDVFFEYIHGDVPAVAAKAQYMGGTKPVEFIPVFEENKSQQTITCDLDFYGINFSTVIDPVGRTIAIQHQLGKSIPMDFQLEENCTCKYRFSRETEWKDIDPALFEIRILPDGIEIYCVEDNNLGESEIEFYFEFWGVTDEGLPITLAISGLQLNKIEQ